MLGAIIGDIVGSRFEFDNIDTKKFKFFDSDCFPTDDSIMTLAIADAIMAWEDEGAHSKKDYERLSALAVEKMQSWGRKYPADYGYSFGKWLDMKNPQPYNSCGNGAAMRVSPVGWAAKDLDDCLKMTEAVTKVTHNHPDGIKGAQSTAVQIFLARQGKTIAELKKYENDNFYPIKHGFSWLRYHYDWVDVCDGTCQAAFACLYGSKNFEDAIRNCMAIGGDSDTLGAICGGIAEAVYGIPDLLKKKTMAFLDENQKAIINKFYSSIYDHRDFDNLQS